MNSTEKETVLHCLLERGDETVTIRQIVDMIVSEKPCGDCINRKETLKALMDEWTEYDSELIDSLIEKIKKLPPVTPQSCEDVISRQAAIVALDNRMQSLENVDMQIAMGFAKGIIHELPPVTPQPKIGRWIMSDDGLYRPICNNCGAHPWKGYIPTVEEATEAFKYCPHCGCKYAGGEG